MSNNETKTIKPNPPADFHPERQPFTPLSPFRYWCQKVLPLVYDDSLSYYELLCKVVDYLNKTMECVTNFNTDMTVLYDTYEQLQEYVNNYFSSLDVQTEINNKLDNMTSDGTLSKLIQPLFDEYKQQIDSEIVQIKETNNTQNSKISTLESRMNEFAKLPSGSTSGDAELIDIRVGYNSKTYDSAGDAVRSQVSNIHEIIKNIKLINVFDKSNITNGGYLRGTVGSDINSVVTLEGAFYCNQIWDVKEGDVIRTSNPYMGISIYDDNNQLIVKYNDDELTEHTLPSGSKKMRYSSTVSSANYIDNAVITINFEMPAEYVEYGLDSFPTYEGDIIVKNIDSKIDEIKNRLNKLESRKTAIILRFDGTGGIDFIDDPRYSLVCEEFGYNCTISVGFSGGTMVTNAEQFKKLMKYGIDFGIYSNNNPPSLTVISGQDEDSITACETYVREATEAAKTIGAYCPVTWLCRQSNSGYALEKALKKYGYMLASGIYYGDANTGLIEDSSKFTLQTSSLTPDTVDDVITKLNTAIEKGYDMGVLTHGFYETEEEARENYSCTEENYRQFLNAVKSYVDAGKAEVLTYSEYISKRKDNAILRTKENQRIANWIFDN